MMTTNCRLCSEPLSEPLLRFSDFPAAAQHLPDSNSLKGEKGADFNVRQCLSCGVVQLDCQPVTYFREVIRASSVSKEMRRFRARQFKSFLKQHSLLNKKVLEVGCGKGEYLSIMREAGADAYGIEYNNAAVECCRTNNLKVNRGYFEKSDEVLPDSPFDAFYMLNFLEHVPNIPTMLAAISNNLNENAFGLIEVPNFDMMLRDNLYTEFIPDHLYYFTTATLRLTLESNGFEVISSRKIWDDYILSMEVRKRGVLNLSAFEEARKKLSTQLQDFINQFPEKSVVVWGAGHQSFAILATTGIAEKIKYVVDSAEFKQGKFTPSTHLPILPPKTIEDDKISAIIVICGGYSNEVVSKIGVGDSAPKTIAVVEHNHLRIIK